MSKETLASADETRLLRAVKKAVDLVDGSGLAPDDAVEKVARAEGMGPGTIRLVGRAYNTGRQLGQWRANSTALDKLASYPLVDPERVIAAVYPDKVDTPRQAREKAAFDTDYLLPPSWLPDTRALEAARRPLTPLTKEAADRGPRRPAEAGDRLRRAHGRWQRAKNAVDDSRRHLAGLEDGVRVKLAALVGYFRQSPAARLPYAQVEHAARVYQGPAAVDLLKLAYLRAGLREPTPAGAGLWKKAFDTAAEPFTTVAEAVKLAGDVIQARGWHAEAQALFDKTAAAVGFDPFVPPSGPRAPAYRAQRTSPDGREKRGFVGEAAGNAVGSLLSGGIKPKADLIEDDWLDLEDPRHLNELRKIKTHAMLNSMLTDPDDPISGHDPDKVISGFNEIAQTAPRLAEHPATVRPLLRKRLAGMSEPFESKEMIDMEQGLAKNRALPINSKDLGDAPTSLLG